MKQHKYNIVDFLIYEKVHLIWQGGDEDIEGELQKFLDTRKGGSEKFRGGYENLYTSKPTGGGAPKILNRATRI